MSYVLDGIKTAMEERPQGGGMSEMICDHPDFHADVAVGRIEDLGRFVVEVRVRCSKCGEPFRFLGLPAGIAVDRPVLSIDGLEATLPIEPEGEKRIAGNTTVHVPKDNRAQA